jgi:hypothetical protein
MTSHMKKGILELFMPQFQVRVLMLLASSKGAYKYVRSFARRFRLVRDLSEILVETTES